MKSMRTWGVLLALAGAGVSIPAGAQVYRCGEGVYSQKPCSRQVLRTDQAVASLKQGERTRDPRVAAGSLRRLPGEDDHAYAVRQRRASLSGSDQDECARLDTRIPFEKKRLDSPHADEVFEAEAAIKAATQRYHALGC